MTVRNPQLFQSADVHDIQSYIDDPAWALEQKVDGMRCLTVLKNDSVEFFTRGGRPLKSSAAKQHFEAVRHAFDCVQESIDAHGGDNFEIVLDAELMTDTGTLVLLDMPYFRVFDFLITPVHTFSWRRLNLAVVFGSLSTDNVKLVQHAATYGDKLDLYRRVLHAGGEGLMAKRLDSPYLEGERVSHSFKLKFTETADVIITGKNSGESKHSKRGGDKINYEFGVYAPDPDADEGFPWTVQHVGNCSGIGKADAEVGDVIEVEYLYVGAGGRLVQPRMIGLRPDKAPRECTSAQLKHYSKEVL